MLVLIHICKKTKGIASKLVALQHIVTNDDMVEFVLVGLGPVYSPFTRSLESRQEDISFDVLYGLLLNEERQLITPPNSFYLIWNEYAEVAKKILRKTTEESLRGIYMTRSQVYDS